MEHSTIVAALHNPIYYKYDTLVALIDKLLEELKLDSSASTTLKEHLNNYYSYLVTTLKRIPILWTSVSLLARK